MSSSPVKRVADSEGGSPVKAAAVGDSPTRAPYTGIPLCYPKAIADEKAAKMAAALETNPYPTDISKLLAPDFDASSPASVVANAASLLNLPPGTITIFADPEDGKFQLTFKIKAETDKGQSFLDRVGDYLQFDKSSKFAELFFKNCSEKTNKVYKAWKSKKVSPAQMHKEAEVDVNGPRPAFTKKVSAVATNLDEDPSPEDLKRVFTLKVNFASKDGTGYRPEDTSNLPPAIGEFFETGALKACPFRRVDNSRVTWDEILPLFRTGKNGSVYLRIRSGRVNLTGAIHRYTSENAQKSNYNRILTLVFGADRVSIYAIEESGDGDAEEAPDEALLAAFYAAGGN